MVRKISQRGTAFSVLAGDTEYQAEFVIFAAPTFLAPYLMEGMAPLHDFEYSPWLTANLTLERLPDSYGTDPSWDNVFMDSPTLATWMRLIRVSAHTWDRTVWTCYWAFGRWIAIGESAVAVEQGLELLEGSDSSRPRARAS